MKRWRKLPLLAAMLVSAGAIAGGALAFDSGGNPGSTGANTITWTGQGAHDGVLDTIQCTGDTPPGTMLWILTVDGGSITNDSTTPVLHLGGTGFGDYTTTNPSDNSSAHFVTPYFTPDSNLTAYADIDVLTTGSGSWNLVISHGCPGRTTVSGPTVSKDANGSYDDTFNWTVGKSADTDTVYSAGGGESGAVTYTVTVSHGDSQVSKVKVTGTIDVNTRSSTARTRTSQTATWTPRAAWSSHRETRSIRTRAVWATACPRATFSTRSRPVGLARTLAQAST